jgi:4-amino-4-deoxy-L-arabinose transferase-like glycosyltransferase
MRNYILLFLACLLFHAAGTWSLPLIDRDEPRFAEASREMREREDLVVPFFNNQFRFDKPPLTYWFQIASYRLSGENDFAARFPTAIAGALVAVVLLAWGTRLGKLDSMRSAAGTDPPLPKRSGAASGRYNAADNVPLNGAGTGWWAAIIFTLCLQTFVHGKAAVADMWLVLFVVLAHWAGWELLRGGRAKFFWTFYLSLAFAFLAKGPIGWTPLLTIVIARRWFRGASAAEDSDRHNEQRLQRESLRLRLLPGILLTLAIVCAWGVPALIRTNGEFFFVGIGKHVIGRSLATMEGHGANSFVAYLALLPLYFVTVFVSFFPWSIKLPALWENLRRVRDASDNFLLVGAFIIFAIFALVKTKLPHYTLPAFPLIALLMARRAKRLRLSPALAWGTALVLLVIALTAPPILSQFIPSYALSQSSRPELSREMEFGAVDYAEPSLVWYFRRDVSGFMTTLRARDAADYLNKPGARFLILPTSSVSRLIPDADPTWRSYRARGWNMAKGERVDVTMLLKPQ